jgi:hypothetical protein
MCKNVDTPPGVAVAQCVSLPLFGQLPSHQALRRLHEVLVACGPITFVRGPFEPLPPQLVSCLTLLCPTRGRFQGEGERRGLKRSALPLTHKRIKRFTGQILAILAAVVSRQPVPCIAMSMPRTAVTNGKAVLALATD